ncbi:phage tail tip lysozyme [Methylobacterium sp. A54F]
MAGNIIQEFLVALGYTVDRNKERAAIDSARRVEQTVRRSDEAATRSTVIGSNRRRIEMDRERGVRTRGAASYIAELRQRQQAEKTTADNSIKAIARRGLAEAKTTAERARWTQKLNQVERQEERERTKESATAMAARTAAMHSYSSGVTSAVAALSGLAAIATTAFGAIAKASEKLEGTFYTSKRTGSSAASIRAFAFAAEQTGSSGKEAIATLEGLAHKLEAFPGYNTMLKRLGVPDKDAAGNTIELTDRMMKLGQVMANMPKPQRYAYAESMGIPAHLVQSLTDPAALKAYNESKARMAKAGLDPAQADRDSKRYMDVWREMGETISIIGAKIQGALVSAFGDKVQQFGDFLLQNADPIAKGVVRIGEAFLKVIDATGEFLKRIGTDEAKASFGEFAKSVDVLAIAIGGLALALTTRLLSPLGKVLGLLTTLGALSPPAWLLAMLGVGAAAQTSTAIAKGGLPAGVDPITGRAPTDEVGSGLIEPGKEGGVQRWLREKYDGAKRAIGGTAVARALGIGEGSVDSSGRIGKAQVNANALAAMDELKKAGLPDEGVAAALGSMQTESSFNPRITNSVAGGHTGLFQWDKNRWPKIKAWIEGQNGDPYDARWQTRALIAEGRAKPGDPLYDHPRTARGWQKLEQSKGDLASAMDGIRDIERYGIGEEGGRGANARGWLPRVQAPTTPGPEQAGSFPNGAPRVLKPNGMPGMPGETMAEADARRARNAARAPSLTLSPPPVPEWRKQAEEAAEGINKQFRPPGSNDNSPQITPWNGAALGVGASSTVSNTSTTINLNGDRNINVTGVSDPKEAALYADLAASRRDGDLFRNMKSAFA